VAVPVVADGLTSRTAGRRGRLNLFVQGTLVRARVVGTLRRFPTVGRDGAFVVADEQALQTALTAAAPGSAVPGELWIGAAPAAEARIRAALGRPPLSALALSSRRALEQRLRGDPLARELSRTLTVAAIAALVLAAAAILLAVVVALRDEGAELYELEAVGADPSTLRADVRLRAALLAALGIVAGVVVGAALLALVVDAVQLTATGRAAFPPLVVVVPWPTWLLIAGAFGLTCAVLVAGGTRRALRGPVPRTATGVAP
jgi:predicted lysophospholipase L1 biosynthesis ABC-type transport system permease subunit